MAVQESKLLERNSAQDEVNQLVARAMKAQDAFLKLNQEQVDRIVQAMALAGLDKHMLLAKMAVEETGRGVYEDKITKNIFATEYIYHSIKHDKTVGIIEVNPYENYQKVAEPVSSGRDEGACRRAEGRGRAISAFRGEAEPGAGVL